MAETRHRVPASVRAGDSPDIPASCGHRPTIGGLVIPAVNVPLADGGVDFRARHYGRERGRDGPLRSVAQQNGRSTR